MKKKTIAFLLLLSGLFWREQGISQERFYPRKELLADLLYLQQQIRDVHADPSRELDPKNWTIRFERMREELKDSMTAAAFFALAKPAVAYLSDEHADISAPDYFNEHAVFPPFSLRMVGNDFVIDTVLTGTALHRGESVIAVNHVPIAGLTGQLSDFTTGFAEERKSKSPEQFGYLYGFAHPYEKKWVVTLSDKHEIEIGPASLKQWTGYLKSLYGSGENRDNEINYKRYGNTGYLTVPNFAARSDADLALWGKKIDSLFLLAARDAVQNLVIDVSRNSGGNSAIGNLLIDHFYTSPYRSYQMNWRRSNEYLAVLKSYGMQDSEYESLTPGANLHRNGDTETPSSATPKFKGKVFVAVGNGTFSSAIMFATIVKDNNMAALVGQIPKMGHPSHFGELYSTRLPHTQLALRFGVKEWLRPNGNKNENILVPDILLKEVNVDAVVKAIGTKMN